MQDVTERDFDETLFYYLLTNVMLGKFYTALTDNGTEYQVRFKLASLTFKALHTSHPPYLAKLLQHHKPTRYRTRVHLPVINYSRFHGTTFHLVLVLFVSQLPKYGIPYRLTFCNLKHSLHVDVI